MSLTRRSLLRNAGGVASLSMFANTALAAILRQRPELILHNGHVLGPAASAVYRLRPALHQRDPGRSA